MLVDKYSILNEPCTSIDTVVITDHSNYARMYSNLFFNEKFLGDKIKNFQISYEGIWSQYDPYRNIRQDGKNVLVSLLRMSLEKYRSTKYNNNSNTNASPIVLEIEADSFESIGTLDKNLSRISRDLLYVQKLPLLGKVKTIFCRKDTDTVRYATRKLNAKIEDF